MTTPAVDILTLSSLGDNYVYVALKGTDAVAVDPAEAACVLDALRERKARLAAVLITHHHFDHCGGVTELVRATGCAVIGPDDRRIPGLTRPVHDDERVDILDTVWEVVGVPGHTKSHCAYYCEALEAVFTGDALFASGCGRIMESSAEQMWRSLCRLAALPESTRVYFGHEYTEESLQFALTVCPEDEAAQQRLDEVRRLLASGSPTAPSTIATEKRANLFLRAAEPAVKRTLGMERATDAQAFAELRRRKDRFG